MAGRGSSRILCVNCNIVVNTLPRYRGLELDTRVTTLLCSWIYPQILTEDDFVCEPCRDLAMFAVNRNLQEASGSDGNRPGPSQRGHTSVCLLCGRSTMKKQKDKIIRQNPTELQQIMVNIVQERVAPRQIRETDHLCHGCWLNVQRQARHRNVFDENRSQSVGIELVVEGSAAAENMDRPQIVEGEPIVLPLSVVNDVNSELEEQQQISMEDPVVGDIYLEQQNEESHSNIPKITLPDYRRAANSNNRCVFTGCNSGTLHSINDKLRKKILKNHNYYIPKLARVCGEHMSSLILYSWETLYESENSMDTFNPDHIQHIFSFVNDSNPTLDFDNLLEIDEKVFKYWIGLNKEQFSNLLQEVPEINEIHRGSFGLATLLLKMRTGDSNERIATLVGVPRRTLENIMSKAREVMLQNFVPRNLGISQLSREQLLDHNLTIPYGLYGNENTAIAIFDGTYIYCHKSSNYMFQKDSYSPHKYRNLLKTFMIVASDGYIVDCFGPYKATTSDAEIIMSLFRDENSPLRLYFREGDVFILDRGFRDSITLLGGCGYRPYIPESLLPGEHQLTTQQANQSRCVTICRWVVEAVNGQLKRDYKLFRQEYVHRSLPYMMQYFQIAAALLNRFGVRFRDHIYANEILEIMRNRRSLPNNLSNMVNDLNMNRRTSNFQSITVDNTNPIYFPILEYRELILFALGTYQIRQARSYYGEHVRFHGGYRIEVCSEQFNNEFSDYNLRGGDNITLLRGKIKSRHVSRKQYFVYILVENNIPGLTGILEYCCNCMVGRRTLGCCAHVMTLVWYLGWARHQQSITAPAECLDDITIREDVEE